MKPVELIKSAIHKIKREATNTSVVRDERSDEKPLGPKAIKYEKKENNNRTAYLYSLFSSDSLHRSEKKIKIK